MAQVVKIAVWLTKREAQSLLVVLNDGATSTGRLDGPGLAAFRRAQKALQETIK